MSIEKIEVENLIDILTEFELTEVEYQKDENIRILLKKAPEPAVIKREKIVSKKEITEVDENIKPIISYEIGKFYYENGLSVGDKIKVGQSIGYVLAMGLKTPIKATTAGEIKEFVVENGGIVDYGKILLKIRQIGN